MLKKDQAEEVLETVDAPLEMETSIKRKPRGRPRRSTRENILRAAKKVFSRSGYDGARIEKISKAARSYDSLIYYYFGSKEKLFVEVLEDAYRDIYEAEQDLNLNLQDPVAALRKIIEFPLRYYVANPEVIVLLSTENLQKGKHIAKWPTAHQYSRPVIDILQGVIQEGQAQGVFKNDIDCKKLYIAITALGYFYVSNRYTFSAFLDTDLMQEDSIHEWAAYISDFVLNQVLVSA